MGIRGLNPKQPALLTKPLTAHIQSIYFVSFSTTASNDSKRSMEKTQIQTLQWYSYLFSSFWFWNKKSVMHVSFRLIRLWIVIYFDSFQICKIRLICFDSLFYRLSIFCGIYPHFIRFSIYPRTFVLPSTKNVFLVFMIGSITLTMSKICVLLN